MNRLYPIGIQNFEKLRKGGFVYVDKTALIHHLVSTGGYYFFGRPRRFGKSLMISTLESYFEDIVLSLQADITFSVVRAVSARV